MTKVEQLSALVDKKDSEEAALYQKLVDWIEERVGADYQQHQAYLHLKERKDRRDVLVRVIRKGLELGAITEVVAERMLEECDFSVPTFEEVMKRGQEAFESVTSGRTPKVTSSNSEVFMFL